MRPPKFLRHRLPLPSLLLLLASVTSIGGCNLTPRYERPEMPLPMLSKVPSSSYQQLEQASLLTNEESDLLVGLDPSGLLRKLADRALGHNRDYELAVLRVRQARAEYGIAKSDQLPSLQATGQKEQLEFSDRSLNELNGQRYSSATIGFNDFELDFFGRVQALSDEARHQFLASELGRQASRKALIAQVAQAFLVMRTEAERKQWAEALLQQRQEQIGMDRRQFESGDVSLEELQAHQTVYEQSLQQVQTAAQDLVKARNALELLTGYSEPITYIGSVKNSLETYQEQPTWLVDLDSKRLLERFDVRAAEEQLMAANASIGAARAAFFPSIRLSTGAGIASEHLRDLFSNGTGTWMFVPQINIPVFDGGRTRANLDLARIRKNISVTRYEKVIQYAFRDMVNGLAERDALLKRMQSQRILNDVVQKQLRIRQAQFIRGDASRLDQVAANIRAIQAEQALSETKLALQMNLLSLYQVLHGADASAVST